MVSNKPKGKKDRFCVAIFTNPTCNDDRFHDEMFDKIDLVGNVDVVTDANLIPKFIEILERKFPNKKIVTESFAVLKIDQERIDQEILKMEKKYKWKRFINAIPADKYLVVNQLTMFDFEYTLLYSTDIDEVLQFLNKRK
ncbi:hypothetical protein [Guptibacillus hwajinpoensis]|uniref:hypothetical protein n=1 Tax=Guptibacillus hwajinpoensis TaxID=208199 RepID=UPI001CFE5448|nr:hypothetical protein [Pseudalkalibacillus hwajinpoensis]WLR59185.1 hypothetical protein LC071_18900 [Pseudalkalibacillus hwajinpoensis]